jgi:phosphoribosylanthranilate isomerase
MFIKICANTNFEDAQLAAELGADAVGFVFAQSPRRVTAEQAAEITKDLPKAIEKIGVFSAAEIETIAEIVRAAGLTGVQLHFPPMLHVIAALRSEFGEKFRIVQTNHWRAGGQTGSAFAEELRQLRSVAEIDAVLVDSRTAVADGGTGVVFDWLAAREALLELGAKPLIIAGGLNAANVGQAIAVLRPWGVDVASGVEASPGKKDPQRLREFIAAARSTERL